MFVLLHQSTVYKLENRIYTKNFGTKLKILNNNRKSHTIETKKYIITSRSFR